MLPRILSCRIWNCQPFFIEKLCAKNANVEGDARFALLNCKRELNSDNNLKTLTEFKIELCLAESQAFKTGASQATSHQDAMLSADSAASEAMPLPHATATQQTADNEQVTRKQAAATDTLPSRLVEEVVTSVQCNVSAVISTTPSVFARPLLPKCANDSTEKN
jgi:hypothetical protein